MFRTSMPETTIQENCYFCFFEYEVRVSIYFHAVLFVSLYSANIQFQLEFVFKFRPL